MDTPREVVESIGAEFVTMLLDRLQVLEGKFETVEALEAKVEQQRQALEQFRPDNPVPILRPMIWTLLRNPNVDNRITLRYLPKISGVRFVLSFCFAALQFCKG